MKTNHRARADFLRELKTLTNELYSLGDFTSLDPDRALLEAKLDGFIQAGLLIEVVTGDEMQQVIDDCHLKVFSETRSERRERIKRAANSFSDGTDDESAVPNWDAYDSPSFDRVKGSKANDTK